MVTFFDTDTVNIGGRISPAYFKNDNGEDGILYAIRAKEGAEPAQSIAA